MMGSTLLDLEKRVSALEEELKSGKQNMWDMASNWENVLLEFADAFGLDAKELRKRTVK